MGNVTPNLRFDYDGALHAARELWQLADEMQAAAGSLYSARTAAVADFSGPMRTEFDDQNTGNRSRLRELAGSARALSEQLGRDWASARGQQDRINYQRYVEEQQAEHAWYQNVWHFVAGEPDYGTAPDNPPASTGPSFIETRCRPYATYGP